MPAATKRKKASEAASTEPEQTVVGEVLPPAQTQSIAEYSATEAGLAALRELARGEIDVTTKHGMEKAREIRRTCVALRTGLDRRRKQLNEDDQARINARNAEAKRLTAIIEEVEAPQDQAIKAEEERVEAEKERKRQQEEARKRALQDRLNGIRMIPVDAVGRAAEDIAAMLSALTGQDFDDFDEVYRPDALEARDIAVAKLRDMHAAAVEAEARAAELAKQAAELERERQAEASRQAEARRKEEQEQQERAQKQAEEDRQRREQQEAEDAQRRERQRQEDEARETARKEQEERDRHARIAEEQRLAAANAELERKQREQAATEAAQRVEEENRVIASASLREAGQEAHELLCGLGQASHITTRKLAAALAKEEA